VKKKARAVSKPSLDGYHNYFISSIWLGRTTRFASLMVNSLSQDGHFAAIFMRSNCGDTKNSCSQPGQKHFHIRVSNDAYPHADRIRQDMIGDLCALEAFDSRDDHLQIAGVKRRGPLISSGGAGRDRSPRKLIRHDF
jgi:hypothetical protein